MNDSQGANSRLLKAPKSSELLRGNNHILSALNSHQLFGPFSVRRDRKSLKEKFRCWEMRLCLAKRNLKDDELSFLPPRRFSEQKLKALGFGYKITPSENLQQYHPGLTSQRHSALISSDSEYFQVCFSAVHYLKISEQQKFTSPFSYRAKI